MKEDFSIKEQQVFAPKDGKPGYLVNKGKPNERWVGIDVEGSNPAVLQRQLDAYARLRGAAQLKADAEKIRTSSSQPPAATPPASTPPASTPPAATPPASTPPASTRPSGTPSTPTPAAPKPSPVAAYMKAAAAARLSKDPAQMAKVRDMGMEIWKAKYKDTLAKKVSPTGQQLGTGQSDMAKQAGELRALRPAAPAPTAPAPQAQSKLSGGASYSPAATKLMSQRTKNVLGVKEQYDAFDLVLEYLLSRGHVDTLDEALYVMMEMSAETVQHIVEGIMPDPINPEVHRRLQRIEKAAKLQKGTTGPESQAAGSAVKRLGGSGVTLPGV